MRKLSKILLVTLLFGLLATPALAASETVQAALTYRDIKITVDGVEITPTDVNGSSTEPFIIDGTTYLPLRAISEALGCDVTWDEATNTVKVNSNTFSYGDTLTADRAIKGISTIGFVDYDGPKVQAIVVEYKVDLTGANLSLDDFVIENNGIGKIPDIGENPGEVTKVYINDTPEISTTGGTGTGRYVIIEVNSDYLMGSFTKPYQTAMFAGVKQVKDIVSNGYTVTASDTNFINYIDTIDTRGNVAHAALEGTFTLTNIVNFQLFTKEDGTAFKATHCFEEATGEYIDVELPYSLYVPDDYNPNGKYALAVFVVDAGGLGEDPVLSLTQSKAPADFASDEIQQIAKDQGLDGIIVVSPQIEKDLRSTRDNWSVSAAVPATWQLLDYITDNYSIDMSRIYGTGQSMGAMQLLEMAAQRDNYFAALWPVACQWGQNYDNGTVPYLDALYYTAPADGDLIWTTDCDGKSCDYRNWYYMVSDDNILLFNCIGDTFSTSVWYEMWYLYHDLCGIDIPRIEWNAQELTVAEQNAKLAQLLAAENKTNIYWGAFEGGNHATAMIYGRAVTDAYAWLLSQTQESEDARGKLTNLANKFEPADEQIQTVERLYYGNAEDLSDEGNTFYLTGKYGSGTAGYNSALYNKNGEGIAIKPNWED